MEKWTEYICSWMKTVCLEFSFITLLQISLTVHNFIYIISFLLFAKRLNRYLILVIANEIVLLQNLSLDMQSVKQKKRKKAIKHFTEGWVEFESKKIAKFVATTLNNTQISTRKKSKFYDIMWNIKYLHR